MNQFSQTKQPFEQPETPNVPHYERIKKRIVEHISSNGLKAGDRLPTEAKLCTQFGLSRQTIGRALNELTTEGVLTRIRGSGTYVAEKKPINRPTRIMICDSFLKNEGEYFGPIFAGIRDAAGQGQFDINYYHEPNIPQVDDVAKTDVDGILLQAPNIEDIQAIMRLKEMGKPVVAMALRSRFGSIATVCTDNFGGLKKAVHHLTGFGHHRLALVTPRMTSSDVQERISGFHQGCFEAGVALDPSYLLLFEKSFGNEVLDSWFDNLAQKPTAIICSVNLAFPIQHMLWKRKLHIPDDVSLIVTDESKLFQNCIPSLTVLSQPLYEMGYRSLTKLVKMIRGEDEGQPEVLPMNFIIRDSVAPVKQI